MTKHNLSVEERFLLYVRKSDDPEDCWKWTGDKTKLGYGRFRINDKLYQTHRVSYALFVDTIPDGMEVCHSCDNRGCVNPSHLWLGTHLENIRDMEKKGRHPHNFIARGEKIKNHKLTEKDIHQIRVMIEEGYTQQEIANVFGIARTNISLIKSGKSWGWLK